MIIFWILAAGLMVLALLFVALPLLRTPDASRTPTQDSLNLQVFRQRLEELEADRAAGFLDQVQYEAARRDLEREALSDIQSAPAPAPAKPGDNRAPVLALILAVAVPVAAVLVYLELGNRAIVPRLEAAAAGIDDTGTGTMDAGAMASLDTLAQGLAERLAKEPDNVDGWLMLGRTYVAVNQPAKALDALERAYKLAPRQPGVLIAYAEALAANNGNRLDGRPAELIGTALEIAPADPSARWLNGMLSYQRDRFGEAAATWEGILSELDPAGEEAAQMRQMIAEARTRAGLPPLTEAKTAAATPSAPAASPAAASAPAAAIRVRVTLSPELGAKAAPQDTLFVFARAVSGPPMPLAVQRLKVADLPASVTLDDSQAMMPAMRLSAFPQVVVGARISKSGEAMPASGDLEGQTGPVALADTPEVSVTIDKARP